MKSNKKGLTIIFLLLVFSTINSICFAQSPKIKVIKDISIKLNQNAKYELPKTVTAIMTNGSKKIVPVSWSKPSINTNKIGTFIYYGEVKNYNKKVKLTVVIQATIKKIDDISVNILSNETFTLPSTVTALLSDNSQRQVQVKWNSSNIKTSSRGTFNFQGTVNGYSKKINLILNVSDTILSIEDLNVTIDHNKTYIQPQTVKAKKIDGTEVEVPIIWDTSIDTSKVGQFTFEGTVIGYSKRVKLNIDIKPVISMVDDKNITFYVDEKYTLPSEIEAKMSDGTTKKFLVKWNSSGIDFSKVGNVKCIGRIDGYDKDIIYNVNIKSNFILLHKGPSYNPYGQIIVTFGKNLKQFNYMDKIILEDENKVKLSLKMAEVADKYKNVLIIMAKYDLKENTKYTLTIPKGTIEAEDGEKYEEDIVYQFIFKK